MNVVNSIKGIFVSTKSRKNRVDHIILRFFNGKSFEESIDLAITKAADIVSLPGFSLTKPTVIYIHGYKENCDDESIKTVVGAYLQRGDHNVIFVDWVNMAFGTYTLNAAPNTQKVGKALGDALIEIIKAGVNKSTIHIVGHSLGAQIAGAAGRKTQEKGVTLPRLTGLDPAFPLFYKLKTITSISKEDADFVDIIHTDAGLYGAPDSTGTVDFWPNGGVTLQPGCPRRYYIPLTENDLQSHWRSWVFWADSLLHPKTFQAVPCETFRKFKDNDFQKSSTPAYMGYDASPDLSGDYYLMTAGTAPYGLGEKGLQYHST